MNDWIPNRVACAPIISQQQHIVKDVSAADGRLVQLGDTWLVAAEGS